MFTSIFSNLVTAFAGLFESIIDSVLKGLKMNLGDYIDYFPFFADVYKVLQGVAVGLLIVIALTGLAKFWLGAVEADQLKDRPVGILLRSVIAAAGIYLGGYLLSAFVSLGTIPYESLIDMKATDGGISVEGIGEGMLAGAAEIVVPTLAGVDLVIALFRLVIVVLILFNVGKLAIEVCERYLLVGVIVFTSPVIYPTIATKEMSQIFKRWWGMFMGSLIMMSVSVIFFKLTISGLKNLTVNEHSYFVSLLIVLAMCKIAQRADSYLQQLGLNVATTGSNMLDDILAAGRAFSHGGGGGGGGSHKGVLGAATGIMGRTPLGQGIKTGVATFSKRGSDSLGESFKKSRAAGAKTAASHNPIVQAVKGAKAGADAYSYGTETGGTRANNANVGAAKAFGASVGNNLGHMVAPNITAAREASRLEQENENMNAAASKYDADFGKSVPTAAALPKDISDKVDAMAGGSMVADEVASRGNEAEAQAAGAAAQSISNAEAVSNLNNYGVNDGNGNFLVPNENADGGYQVSKNATAAGVSLEEGRIVASTPEAAGHAINQAAKQAEGANSSEIGAVVEKTVAEATPDTAVRALEGPSALNNEYGLSLAQKAYGGSLQSGETITSYRATDSTSSSGGPAVRQHEITVRNTSGEERTIVIMDQNAATASGKINDHPGRFDVSGHKMVYVDKTGKSQPIRMTDNKPQAGVNFGGKKKKR